VELLPLDNVYGLIGGALLVIGGWLYGRRFNRKRKAKRQ